jgi:integrase
MSSRIKTKYAGIYIMEKTVRGVTQRKEKVFYCRYRGADGRLVEEKVGSASLGWTASKAATERALRIQGKHLSNRQKRAAAEAARQEEESRPTISRLFALYDEQHAARRSRYSDVSRYKLYLSKAFGTKTPDQIVTLDVDRVRLTLLKKLSPATVHHVLTLLKRIVSFGVSRGLCQRPDEARLRIELPRVDNTRTESMTHEQMSAYLAALDKEPNRNLAAALKLALTTGIRKGALMSLLWEDVDFQSGFISLQGKNAKSGRTSRIPLSRAARAVLEQVERTADSEFIFPGGRSIEAVSRRIRDAAGLPKDFRPMHGLRHSFASALASSGKVDLYTLQQLLTHGSPQMTMRYAHLHDQALKRAAGVADEIFKEVSAS